MTDATTKAPGEALYQERVMDHYLNPRNFGTLDAPDVEASADNPLCGDEICVQARLDGGGRIAEIAFQGHGCAISQASTSMLTEDAMGKAVSAIAALDDAHMLALIGVHLSAARAKCALLGLHALQEAIREREAREETKSTR